jgi:hypothetical protein
VSGCLVAVVIVYFLRHGYSNPARDARHDFRLSMRSMPKIFPVWHKSPFGFKALHSLRNLRLVTMVTSKFIPIGSYW